MNLINHIERSKRHHEAVTVNHKKAGLASRADAQAARTASQKALRRLGPFLALMFAISILDRANVGFAKEALKADVGIGDTAFAFGAGIFFVGYALFEIPSNLMLHRVGAKLWLSRIMVTWGISSALMMFIHSNISFYVLRFLVGVAEAGFSPGVVLYCTYWFTKQDRGKALGIYYMGLPAALVIGSAVSGALMGGMKGYLGLHNWQWMFLLEGLTASAVGVVAYFYLASKPRDASWLTSEERDALECQLALEERERPRASSQHLISVLTNRLVVVFVAIYFAIQVGAYGVIFYLPSHIATIMATEMNTRVGLIVAIPWSCAFVALRIITKVADAKGNHRQYAMILLVLAAFGMVASTQTSHLILTTIAFSLAAIGFVVVQPLFWTLPTAYLNGRAAAAGIALIGSIGNLGGFVAPTLKTVAERAFGSQNAGMLFLSAIALVGVFLLAWVKQDLGNSRVLSRSI